jgi:hypothetical protein
MARSRGPGLEGDRLTQRAAEVLDRRERAGRLGNALARMARDLAGARKRIVALERENTVLRRQLKALTPTARDGGGPAGPSEGPID